MSNSSYISYSEINSLGEFACIANSDLTIEFPVTDEQGLPLNLSGATCSVVFSLYGKESEVLTLSGTVTGINTFEIELDHTDTINFDGKYSYQPIIEISGKTYRPAQGVIYFVKAI